MATIRLVERFSPVLSRACRWTAGFGVSMGSPTPRGTSARSRRRSERGGRTGTTPWGRSRFASSSRSLLGPFRRPSAVCVLARRFAVRRTCVRAVGPSCESAPVHHPAGRAPRDGSPEVSSPARVRSHTRADATLARHGPSPAPARTGPALRSDLPRHKAAAARRGPFQSFAPSRIGTGCPAPAFLQSARRRRSTPRCAPASRLRSPFGSSSGRGATCDQLS